MAAEDRNPNGRWSTTGQCTTTRRLQYSNRYYTGERLRYFFYITNDRTTPADQIVFQANDRCDQENLIANSRPVSTR